MQSVEFYFDLFGPQYSSAANKDNYIIVSEERTGKCYGKDRNFAVALRALHWIALDDISEGNVDDGTSSGEGDNINVTRIKEGRVEKEYGQLSRSTSDAYLSQTKYGLQLLELSSASILSVMNRFSAC